MLYKYHVVDDDAVVDWWEHPFNTDVSKKIRKITTRFIEWVQAEDDDDEEDSDEEDSDEEDDEDNNDESDDDEDDDCGIDFDYDDDDDDAVEDDEIEFSYAESPLSEETAPFEDSSDIELHTNSLSDHDSLDHLLNTKEREICVCHLDKDTIPSSSQKHEPLECSCNIYSPSPSTEKKKKSVRIALLNRKL
ncbi:MAG: hypothetical protein EXX96DRAFT_14620 [Benjaminiella poitrasii]|nr:MAG: hypothetical protein EXX96DRAFT_14620 [Benjaminiella poitrasii]